MSPARIVRKLRSMSTDEVRFRTSSVLRREAARISFLARRPAWRREALAGLLRSDDPSLRNVRAALQRSDWMAAHELFMQHVVTRPRRFVLTPSDRASRIETIRRDFPGATADAIRRGESLISRHFDLLGYRNLSFSNGGDRSHIDWHFDPVHQRRVPKVFWSRVPFLDPECGDHKIIWELNRHQYLLALGRAYWLSGDTRFREAFVEHFDSWISDNRPLEGMNWASMLELGLRSISWIWALHFFALPSGQGDERSPWTVDLLMALDRQLSLVAENMSRFFSPNTHLLGEALALYVAGRALPELRHASRWEHIGRSVLLEQIGAQINKDGGHAELSTHYHRYTLDFYLLALVVARETGDRASTAFAGACAALAGFARSMADDNGLLPTIGDDDGGMLFPIAGRDPADASDSLQLAAELLDTPALAVGLPAEEVVWIGGRGSSQRDVRRWPSAALTATGYFVSRSERGDHLTVDAGPHGFLNGGHAHADALSVTLSVRGQRLLIDPGTACYTINRALRDRFRSTEAHNTLVVDGKPQSAPDGPFHWRTAARGTATDWQSGEGVDYFEGSHDGYEPIVHRRAIVSRPGCWIFIDRVSAQRAHSAAAHWHLDPAWSTRLAGGCAVHASREDGETVWIASLADACEIVRGDADSSTLGWCAPVYGSVVPSSTITFTKSADAPFDIITVVLDSSAVPTLESLSVTVDGQQSRDATAFRLSTRDWVDTLLMTRWAGQPPAASSKSIWSAGGLETNARFVCWREDHAGSRAQIVLDGAVLRHPSTLDVTANALG